MPARDTQGGFSLLELIVVIVIIGIIAGLTTRFFGDTVSGYVTTSLYDQLARSGRLAVERVNRELRNAAPNSIRVSGNCIEFLPLVASASYQDQAVVYAATGTASAPTPVLGASAASDRWDVFDLGFAPVGGATYYMLVYPYGPGSGAGDPYQAQNPGPLVTFQAIDTGTALPAGVTRLQATTAHRFLRHSPARRLFLTGTPVSFCVVGNQLLRYAGYGLQATQPVPPPAANAQLLASEIQTVDPDVPFTASFGYQSPSLVRNGVVTLDFRFMRVDARGNANWVRLNHEVEVANVP